MLEKCDAPSIQFSILAVIGFLVFCGPRLSYAQGRPAQVRPILSQPIRNPYEVSYQLKQYLEARIVELSVPQSAAAWTAEGQKIRNHLLKDVIFHGWPSDWVNAPPRFEDAGAVPSGKGYRMRKFRYEIVPGFWSTAILYLPEHLEGRVPAILDVMGHFPKGKASAFEQELCINQALRGMIALNLEWIGMGELRQLGNEHWYLADLDLVGANGVGLFYLAMRRGLDYLYDDPQVDRSRIGVMELSGGGWQTHRSQFFRYESERRGACGGL